MVNFTFRFLKNPVIGYFILEAYLVGKDTTTQLKLTYDKHILLELSE